MPSSADIIVVGDAAYYRADAPDGWEKDGVVCNSGSAEWYQAIYNYWM